MERERALFVLARYNTVIVSKNKPNSATYLTCAVSSIEEDWPENNDKIRSDSV